MGLKRDEIPEIPLRAIVEAIVNSFVHRDYCSPESNKIAIFEDRIEIWNPGEFPKGYSPFDFIKNELPSILRNPIIANVLYLSADIEKWGSGLKRIFEECLKSNVKVNFKLGIFGFAVVFYRTTQKATQKATQKTTQKTTQKKLNSTQEKIVGLLRKNPGITRGELAMEIGNISPEGIKYHLNQLKRQGVIERVGRIVNVPENVPDDVPVKRLERIEQLMTNNGKITIPEIAKELTTNEKTIKRDIDKLKKSGRIKRIGPDRAGRWEIL